MLGHLNEKHRRIYSHQGENLKSSPECAYIQMMVARREAPDVDLYRKSACGENSPKAPLRTAAPRCSGSILRYSGVPKPRDKHRLNQALACLLKAPTPWRPQCLHFNSSAGSTVARRHQVRYWVSALLSSSSGTWEPAPCPLTPRP